MKKIANKVLINEIATNMLKHEAVGIDFFLGPFTRLDEDAAWSQTFIQIAK